MSNDILRAFQETAKQEMQKNVGAGQIICVVQSVDAENQSCTCVNEDDSEDVIYNVRLGASYEESNIIFLPTVGSYVIVTLLDRSNAYISKYSQITECKVKSEGFELDAQKGKFDIKNDSANLKDVLNSIISFLESATYTNSAGPTGVANNVATLQSVKTKITQLLK